MHRRFAPFPRRLVCATAAAAALGAAALPSLAEPIVGLTTNNALVRFDSATPGSGSAPTFITGLEGVGQSIVGIDLRPTNGLIYGVSTDSKLYTLNPTTGAASKVADLTGATLNGASFGVDFNPVADLSGAASLRIVSNTGQNLAVNANTGAVTVQTTLSGGATGASGAAYSNNDLDAATGTTLYYIDATSDALYSTAAPAGGVLSFVGNLGVDTSSVFGFDITGSANRAYAGLTAAGGGSSLYTVDLGSGAATLVGAFNLGPGMSLLGLTANVAPIPEPSTYALMLAGLASVAAFARRRAKR